MKGFVAKGNVDVSVPSVDSSKGFVAKGTGDVNVPSVDFSKGFVAKGTGDVSVSETLMLKKASFLGARKSNSLLWEPLIIFND